MKFKTKKNVPPRLPKKSKKADLGRYSTLFFWIGMVIVLSAVNYVMDFKTFYYDATEGSGNNSSLVVPQQEQSESDESVLQLDPEQLDNIQNAIAYTHAVWPGYKGDISDGDKVRKHFANNLASVVVKAGGVSVPRAYRVHFYYVVRDDGGIQFLALVNGGKTSKDLPMYILKHTQKILNIGVPGIQPGTNETGEPITVIYELLIKFISNDR